MLQKQGQAGGLGAPVQGEQKEPGDEKQHRRGQKIPAVVKQGGAHAPGQRQFNRGPNQHERRETEQFQGGGKLKPVIPRARQQRPYHHPTHAHGIVVAQAPGHIHGVFLEQQRIQREPEELDAQAEAPKDRQEKPKAPHRRQAPEAGRGRGQAYPGENPGRVTVADNPHGEGYQDGVQAQDRVKDPDLAPGEVEAPL